MPNHLHRFHTTPVMNGVPRVDELPMWSGDGRGSYANPLFPMYGQRGGVPSGSLSGDGHGRRAPNGHAQDEVTIKVNPGPPTQAAAATEVVERPAKRASLLNRKNKASRPTQISSGPENGKTGDSPSDTWKLIALVVVFLVWVSTASTLLFLYMDRYLFP